MISHNVMFYHHLLVSFVITKFTFVFFALMISYHVMFYHHLLVSFVITKFTFVLFPSMLCNHVRLDNIDLFCLKATYFTFVFLPIMFLHHMPSEVGILFQTTFAIFFLHMSVMFVHSQSVFCFALIFTDI